jgi:uncharacterized protein (TIGR00297 family)
VLWPLSLVSEDLVAERVASVAALLPAALIANIAVASAGFAGRAVSVSGAICGTVIGLTIFLFAGWRGWMLLLMAFAVATATSRMGLRRKTILGIAEAREGRRGAGNAIANTGIAAAAAVVSAITYANYGAMIAFVAALTAGASDTIASEIGKAWGKRTWLLVPLRRVPPGTSGAISLEGTAAGLLGAFALAAAAVGLDLVPAKTLLPIVAGATIGSFVESALGATLEANGVLNNDVLNFINTGVAAFAALMISGVA